MFAQRAQMIRHQIILRLTIIPYFRCFLNRQNTDPANAQPNAKILRIAKEFTGKKRIKNMKNFAPLYPFGDNRAKGHQLYTILWITLDNFLQVIHNPKP